MQSMWRLKHSTWTHNFCEHINNFLHLGAFLAISNLLGLTCSTPLFSQRIEALRGEIICRWVTAGYWECSFTAQQSSHVYTTAGHCCQPFTQKEVKGSLRKNAVWSKSPGLTVWRLWLPVFRKIMPLQLALWTFPLLIVVIKPQLGNTEELVYRLAVSRLCSRDPMKETKPLGVEAGPRLSEAVALLHVLWTGVHEGLHWKVSVTQLKSRLPSTNLMQSSNLEN